MITAYTLWIVIAGSAPTIQWRYDRRDECLSAMNTIAIMAKAHRSSLRFAYCTQADNTLERASWGPQ